MYCSTQNRGAFGKNRSSSENQRGYDFYSACGPMNSEPTSLIYSFLILFTSGFLFCLLNADELYAMQSHSAPAGHSHSETGSNHSSDTLLANPLLQRYLNQFMDSTSTIATNETPDHSEPIKCLTLVVKQYEQLRPGLSKEERQLMDQKIYSPPLQDSTADSLISPSGKFKLKYTTTGTDSVPATDRDSNGIPDYVEWAASYADSTWRAEINHLNYPDPLEQQGQPYEIYLAETGNFYGSTFKKTGGPGTYIEVHRNFNGFPPNTDPEGNQKGALKATIAHEFKHAINYFITNWQGEVDEWAEMDATLMEELVFDPVNDYYNYINSFVSIFNAPGRSLYPGSYEHVSFAIYFTENFGPLFWTGVWDRIIESGDGPGALPMFPAIDSTLQTHDPNDLKYHFTRSHLWHFASGSSRVTHDFGFEERFDEFNNTYAYPPSNLTHKHDSLGVPDSVSDWRSVSNLSAQHISITPMPADHGPVQIELQYDTTEIGVGLIAYTDEGVQTRIHTSRNKGSIALNPDWWWGRLDRLGLVVTNPSPYRSSISYRIRYGTIDQPLFPVDLPDQPVLEPNYPNPFNQSTTFSFVLPHTQDVTFKVYNAAGRLVRTLHRSRLPPGPHTIRFDASNLSSGLYIYQMITENRVQSDKMILLK